MWSTWGLRHQSVNLLISEVHLSRLMAIFYRSLYPTDAVVVAWAVTINTSSCDRMISPLTSARLVIRKRQTAADIPAAAEHRY